MHTVLSNENGEFYTAMIYPCFSRSVCFSMGSPAWWRFGPQARVPACLDDVTLCSCAKLKCDFADVNKYINADFRSVKWVSFECDQPYRENISWYIRSDCIIQLILNQSPPASYFQLFPAPATACESQATACDTKSGLDMLWIGVNCIFKENIFHYIDQYLFKLKTSYFNFHSIFICTTCKHFIF